MFSGQAELYLAQLRGGQQKPQESVQDFAQAIRKLTDDAYAGIPEEARNRFARDHFMNNLRDREIRSAVHLSRPASMEQAIQTALETEAFLTAEKQRAEKQYNSAKYTRMLQSEMQGSEETSGTQPEILKLMKQLISQNNQRLATYKRPERRNGGRQGGSNFNQWRSRNQWQRRQSQEC